MRYDNSARQPLETLLMAAADAFGDTAEVFARSASRTLRTIARSDELATPAAELVARRDGTTIARWLTHHVQGH